MQMKPMDAPGIWWQHSTWPVHVYETLQVSSRLWQPDFLSLVQISVVPKCNNFKTWLVPVYFPVTFDCHSYYTWPEVWEKLLAACVKNCTFIVWEGIEGVAVLIHCDSGVVPCRLWVVCSRKSGQSLTPLHFLCLWSCVKQNLLKCMALAHYYIYVIYLWVTIWCLHR